MSKSAQTPMKPEIKQQWLAALRSGNYTQGRSVLVATTRGQRVHCCLGVLAEVIKDENNTERSTKAIESNNILTEGMADFVKLERSPCVSIDVAKKHMTGNPRRALMTDVGLGDEKEVIELWKLNDRYEVSFPELANIIEEAF